MKKVKKKLKKSLTMKGVYGNICMLFTRKWVARTIAIEYERIVKVNCLE